VLFTWLLNNKNLNLWYITFIIAFFFLLLEIFEQTCKNMVRFSEKFRRLNPYYNQYFEINVHYKLFELLVNSNPNFY